MSLLILKKLNLKVKFFFYKSPNRGACGCFYFKSIIIDFLALFCYNDEMIYVEKRKDRWKILWMMLLFASVTFGYVLSQISANVLFVKRIGSYYLPYVYLSNAVLVSIAALFVAIILTKVHVTRIVQSISAISGASLLVIYFLITRDFTYSYPAFLILSHLAYLLLSSVLIWDLAIKLSTPFEARRTFIYFSLGSSIGGILASITASIFSRTLGTELLVPVISFALFLTLFFSFVIHKRYSDRLITSSKYESASNIALLKQGFKAFQDIRLARLLAACFVLFYVVRWIGDYEFQKILGDAFTEEKFTQIASIASIIENAILVAVFLFFQRWIIKKLGVLKTFLSAPISILLPFVLLFFFPIYIIAIGLKLTARIVDNSTFSNPVRLLFTAIPKSIRGSVMSIIGSNAQAAGILIAGMGLLILTRILDNQWIILIAIFLTLLIAFLIILVKNEFVKQITKNLSAVDIEDVHGAIENFAEPAYHTVGVQELMKMVSQKEYDTKTIRKIIFSLGKIDNVTVIPSLLDLFEKSDVTVRYSVVEAIHSFTNLGDRLADFPFTRLNIIDIYKKVLLESEDTELRIFILKHLKDLDPDIVIEFIIEFLRQSVASKKVLEKNHAIRAMKYFHDRGIVRYIKSFLNDENTYTRASSIIVLWQFKELRIQLFRKYLEIMNAETKNTILSTFMIISELKFKWDYKFIKKYIDDSDEEIRSMAALRLLEIDKIEGIDTVVASLVNRTKFSKTFARAIKGLSEKMKEKLFKKLREFDHEHIETCIDILTKTYLNFEEEIEYLKGGYQKTVLT